MWTPPREWAASRDAGNHRHSDATGAAVMGRSERPVDTRDFYTPALGALVTTGAATSHPATYVPSGGAAVVMGQTHHRISCHARADETRKTAR